MFVELIETGQQAIMAPAGRNGDVVTWSTVDGRSISLQAGILVATRGFGHDLMSADVSGTIAALNGGSTEYEVFVSYLDGENNVITRSFTCKMSSPEPETINSFGRRIAVSIWVEQCQSLDGETQALYWTLGNEVWRTQQLTTKRLERLVTERLTSG